MRFTKPSEPLARQSRCPKMARPRSSAQTMTAPAAQTRAETGSARSCARGSRPRSSPGSCGSSGPRMESTVTRTICGTRALNTWLNRLSSSPAAKYQATGRR